MLAKLWEERLYILAANSSEEPIQAKIRRLPLQTVDADVLFKNRRILFDKGYFSDPLEGLGVNIYRISVTQDRAVNARALEI